MEQDPHIIRRQLLEFVTDDTAGSYALQDEMALLYNELVLPMIDRCFTEVSAQRNIAPIDRLELDLGTLDRHNLRASFLQKAESALRKKLAEIGGSAVRLEHTETFSEEGAAISPFGERNQPKAAEDEITTGVDAKVWRITDDSASGSATSAEESFVNENAPHHGKTFHFNLDEDQEENETVEQEMNDDTEMMDEVTSLIPSSRREESSGKTIHFNTDDSVNDDEEIKRKSVERKSYADTHLQKEDFSNDGNSTSSLEGGMRRVASDDEVSVPNTTIPHSPSEEHLPFHGKTFHFNTEDDTDDASPESHASGERPDDAILHPDAKTLSSGQDVPFISRSKEEARGPVGDQQSTIPRERLDLPKDYLSGSDPGTQSNSPTAAIQQQQSTSDHTSISLIRFYLRTGLFPWWARETSRDAFERAVRDCILAGKDLPQLVALLNRPESLLRFTSLPDEVVRAVAVAISPMNEATLLSMQPSWEKLLPTGRLPARQHWWITVFSASAARRLTQAKAYDPAETIAAFLEPYPEQATEAREKKFRNTFSKRLSLLEKFFSQNGFTAETSRLRTVHELLSKKGNAQEELPAAQWSAVHRRLLGGETLSEGWLLLTGNSAQRKHDGQFPTAADQQFAATLKTTEPAVNYMEKIFIDNAGLVLCWPFLTLFFERLELTEENRFKDVAAQEKAMAAMEILVRGNEHAPFFEASLPLNKLLCGALPETPVHTDHPFRKAELKMIDGLLAAVMERSELGKNLSAAGFREAWLQRKGALSVRDGHWLLQVERKTHDILLEAKLPWAINIVKLPWMDNLLAVEW